MEIVFIERL